MRSRIAPARNPVPKKDYARPAPRSCDACVASPLAARFAREATQASRLRVHNPHRAREALGAPSPDCAMPDVAPGAIKPIIPQRMSVILLGYRGSGKTTIGKRLADRLWWKFVDTDELVTRSAGKTIKEIFEQSGENEFRDLEIGA